MKYVFFGTPAFAAIILEKLIEAGMPPVLVVCNPDRPKGRAKTLTPPPVKVIAEENGIEIMQPENIRESNDHIKTYGAAIGILAAYGKIVPQSVIDIFPKGIVGVHPSLLPKYRGPTPIQTTLLKGEEKTGTSLFLVDNEVDHGPIITQEETTITARDTYTSLHDALAVISADLLTQTLPQYLSDDLEPVVQDHGAATFTQKFETDDARVDFKKDDTKTIWRKIRALNPEPGVFTMHPNETRIKLLEAEYLDDRLILKKIQRAGKTPRSLSLKESEKLIQELSYQ